MPYVSRRQARALDSWSRFSEIRRKTVIAEKQALIDEANARFNPVRMRSGPSFLYILQCREFVKIGYSCDVKYRLQELQCGNPLPIRVLRKYGCLEYDAIRLERALHSRYEAHRHSGEWFALPVDVRAALLKEDFGALHP